MFSMLRLSTVYRTTAKRTYAAYGFYIHLFEWLLDNMLPFMPSVH